jgi:hypothetical protein
MANTADRLDGYLLNGDRQRIYRRTRRRRFSQRLCVLTGARLQANAKRQLRCAPGGRFYRDRPTSYIGMQAVGDHAAVPAAALVARQHTVDLTAGRWPGAGEWVKGGGSRSTRLPAGSQPAVCIDTCRSVQVGLQTPKVWICSSTLPGSAGPWSRTTSTTLAPSASSRPGPLLITPSVLPTCR